MSLAKRFVTLGLTGLLLIGVGAAANAQTSGQRGGGPTGQSPMVRLSERLSLNADQQTQVKAIFDRHFAEAKSQRAAFEATLTPEQKAEREARRQEWESKRQARANGNATSSDQKKAGQRPHRGPGGGPMANLSPEQREAFHAKMQAERQAIDSEIQAVLTPAQRQIFEQMKAEQSQRRGPGRERSNG